MAEEKKPSWASLPTLPVPGLTSIGNVAGMSSDPDIKAAGEEYWQAAEKYINDLQKRYDQPNWFKVAAGFAKPQLGGFIASLGSANEALGEWAENQRALEPTISQMRMDIAAKKLGYTQQRKATEAIEKDIEEGKIPSPLSAAKAFLYGKGPVETAQPAQNIASAQAADFRSAFAAGLDYGRMKFELGDKYTDEQLVAFLRNNPSVIPPTGTPMPILQAAGRAPKPVEPPIQAQPAAAQAVSPSETPKASTRVQIPGVTDVNSLIEKQYLEELSKYNTQKQEAYATLTKNVGTQATGGQKVYETAQQIHDIASDPALTPIFAQFEKGNPAGILGKILESQTMSSTLANMRDIATTTRLGGKDALTKLNRLGSLMGVLQTEMQNAVINPTNERTMAEFASLPNLRNSQDAFLRGIRYIANEGLTKYENQLALKQASKKDVFDPNYWNNDPLYQNVVRNSTKRRDAINLTPATQDRPAFMRGSIDQAAYNDEAKPKKASNQRLTAKQLRELANQPD